MSSHPAFAIVGHPNKGKSSIVATLAEDESIAISPDPGTTRRTRGFRMRVDGEVLYELFDTPGFQRPRAMLAWLKEHERGANARAVVVREFLAAHREDAQFENECELLRPVLDGAGILYVVDGAHPYGAEYEAEMEILRWTGQPRMALINMIGPGDHVEEWRRALNQYFSIVRVFDAQRADFGKRLELLRAFRELGEVDAAWSRALERAVDALERNRADRRRRAAAVIADLLIDVLSMRESAAAPSDADQSKLTVAPKRANQSAMTVAPEKADEPALTAALVAKLKTNVRKREQLARREVQDLYAHRGLSASEQEMSVLADDLFSARSFAVFGLSSMQLALTGAATGAVAGGVVDLAVGGASLLLGAGIGAVVGGVGTLLGAERVARVQVLGTPLGGHRLTVGPITAPNVPWVILGRAVLHHRLVAERNHARREALVLDATSGEHLADQMDPSLRKRMAAAFARIRKDGGLEADARDALVSGIEACLGGRTNLSSRRASGVGPTYHPDF